MVMPSGWRSSEPVPVPSASGSAPRSAAIVTSSSSVAVAAPSIAIRIGAYLFPSELPEMLLPDETDAYLHPDDFNHLLVQCLETPGVKRVNVRVEKTQAIAFIGSVGVEIEREKA